MSSDYQQTRAGEHPRSFLADFTGHLQVDGYAGRRRDAGTTQAGTAAVRPASHERDQRLDGTDLTQVVPQRLLGKAIGYALGQWERVMAYLDDDRL